ncbi:MAG: TonB-dependent receptor, partial [Phycisphaerae bacterium]|nr:TonB-dependent receptor [Phycisphaerae bacterium]
LSWQVLREEQFRIKGDNTSDRQGFEVNTLGFWLQLESPSRIGRWTYGTEYYRDWVDSFKAKYNADGTLKKVEIQGPVADDATYDLLGIFVQNEIPITDSLDLILGARYDYARADAGSVKDPETGNKISISESWETVVGSARFLYHMDEKEHWHLFGGVSQGFRTPNLSDLTRLDTARTNEIETAAPGLEPEKFISYEIGVKSKYENLSGQVAYFYTDIRDMIVRTPTGNIIDGDSEVTKKNAGDGFIHGIELSTKYRFHPKWTAFGSFTWMDGEVDTYPTSSGVKNAEPIDRLMPPTGNLGLRWEPNKKFWLEAACTIAAKQDDLSTRDKADTQRIPPGGTPGYTILTVRGGWKLRKNLTLWAALENITDEDYRIHGSGQNEPGRNLIVSIEWKF